MKTTYKTRAIALLSAAVLSVSVAFAQSETTPEPVISLSDAFVVKMECAAPDSKIYYTFDTSITYGWGDDYNKSICKLYEGEFTLTQAAHIYAFAEHEGWERSGITHVNYYDDYFVNSPYIYDEASDDSYKTISMTPNYDGATIYYTIDGSDPNTSNTRKKYDEPFVIYNNLTIKAISTFEGRINSPITERYIDGINSKFKQGGIYFRRIDNNPNDEVEVTNGDTGYSGEISIPESVTNAGKTYAVTRIGNYAFYDQNDITSVNIPSSVLSIGEHAFQSCDGLKAITIPSNVKTLEYEAFRECYNMAEITFNEGLESIGYAVFYDNQTLKEVFLPSTLKTIGNYAFGRCYSMTKCVISEGTETIGNYAFVECRALTSIALPNSITFLGEYCFSYCTNLPSIKLPQSMKVIPFHAFEYCYNLLSVEIPATVQEILGYAFWHCERLISASVPEGVTVISPSCFSECYMLNSITLPSTITTIQEYGLFNCRSLKTITLPASLAQIDQYAFNGCDGLTSVYLMATTPPAFTGGNTLLGVAQNGATLYVPSEAVDTYKNTTLWQEFDPNIAAIGNIPAAQPTFFLENYTLSMSTQTADAVIYYTDDNTDPTTDSKRYTQPIDFLYNDTIRAIAVKEGMDNSEISEFRKGDFKAAAPVITMEEVGEGTFEVTIKADKPDARIEDSKVYYTTQLRWGWATWPSGSDVGDELVQTDGTILYEGKFTLRQATHVAAAAVRNGWLTSNVTDANFYDDYVLNQPTIDWNWDEKTITINPNNNKEVSIYYTIDGSDPNDSKTRQEYTEPFTLSRNLIVRAIAVKKGHFNSLVSERTVDNIDNSFFVGDIRYRFVDNTIENEVEVTSKDGGFSGRITIPESVTFNETTYRVTRIGRQAFFDCDNMKTIHLPNTIVSIGYQAFYSCDGFTEIELPNNLITIEDEAFRVCRSLSDLSLPEGLQSLGNYSFSDCTGLQSLVLPKSLENMGEYAFNCCTKLKSVQIPSGFKELSHAAFYQCETLPSIAIPEGITTIPIECFERCYALSSVSLPSTLTKLDRWAFNGCSSLTTITLPASVNEIHYRAFKECNAMTSLYALPTTPPAIVTDSNENPFGWIKENCTLYVPSQAALEAYQNADYWKEFTNIAVATELPCDKPTYMLNNFMLTISTQTEGAAIYYTRDNSDPTTDSELYNQPIDFSRNDTIRAIAVKEGLGNSEVSEFRKNDFKVATPDVEFSFAEGWLKASSPSPATNVEEAKLYYTMTTDNYWGPSTYTNEEEVLKNATLFTEPLEITRPGKIQVVALRDGWLMSDWRYFDFYSSYYQDQPNIGWDSSTKTVTITHNDAEVTIYYTLDGTDPNTSETRKKYEEPFTVIRNHVVKAIVEKPEHYSSVVKEYAITNVESRFQKDGLYYRLVDNTEEDVIEVTSPAEGNYAGDYVIPTSVTHGGVTYKVSRIGNDAFRNQTGVTSVSIPSSVISIGQFAFYNCDGLTVLDIPGSVKTIEAHSIRENDQLTEITFHDGLETIGDDAFVNCNKLKSLALPATLTSIGYESFANCSSLKEVTFPQSLTTIGEKAFNYCTSLTELNLPNSVTSIGQFAFSHNESLISIHIPEKLTKLPQDMLSFCYKLPSVEIPASVQELSQGVFYNDQSLKSIVLPEGITIIPLYQFSFCTSLVSVSLPSTITTIGTEAFYQCTSLQSIVIPDKVESIGSNVFSGCTALTSVYSLNVTPPSIESNTWSGVTSNATLYLPSDEAVAAYETANYWSNFKSIEKMGEGLPCAQPSFTLDNFTLTINTDTEGASIYYTNDGSDPTTGSILYKEPIDFLHNDTIRAIAVKQGMNNSPISEFSKNDFKVDIPIVEIPLYNISIAPMADGGVWKGRVSRTTSADDWMSPDFNDSSWPEQEAAWGSPNNYPNVNTSWTDEYSDIYIRRKVILTDEDIQKKLFVKYSHDDKFELYLNGTLLLETGTGAYTNQIEFLSASQQSALHVGENIIAAHCHNDAGLAYADFGLYGYQRFVEDQDLQIIITAQKPDERLSDAKIYYNYNESSYWPTQYTSTEDIVANCQLYTEPLHPKKPGLMRVYALRDGWINADRVDFNYFDNYYLAPPTINWDRESRTITITSNNSGDDFYYTLDGSDPNSSSTRITYLEPFTIERNLTVRAVSVQVNHFNSEMRERVVTDVDSRFFVDDIRYRLVDNTLEKEVEVTGKEDGYSGDITIPESISYEGTTYQVTRIGNNAFNNCDNLQTVTLPNTITSIGSRAFYSCDNLLEMTIPSSVVTIEQEAFYSCTKLSNLILSEGLKTMENYVFADCRTLEYVILPSTLEVIPERAFYNCSKLVSVQIPKGVKELGTGSFYKCYALSSVIIPEGITSIPPSCFEECSVLSSVSLPSTLKKLDRWAFNYCYALTTITLPASVNEINYRAFKDCNAMTSLYALPTTPPAIVTEGNESPFAWIIENCTLYVPSQAALEAYQNADYWKEFTNIAVATELPCDKPTFLFSNYKLSMATQTTEAIIYFTNDNTDPTTDSKRYSQPIDFNRNDTIRAIAVKEGYANSEVSEFRKNDFKVATPDVEFSFEEGWLKASSPSPAANVEEAKLYYTMTTDDYWGPSTYNNEADVLKNATLFTEPLKLTRPGKIQVVALRDGWLMSDWRSFDFYSDYYQNQPSISWDSSTKTVTITHSDAEVTIYYTLDGTDPNTSETRKKYVEPFSVLRNYVVKAIVEKPQHFSSVIKEYAITDVDSRFHKEGLYYRLVDNTEENVIEVTSPAEGNYAGDYVIPESVLNGGVTYKVSRIGNNAFQNQSEVTSVIIPSSVTSIGQYAFYNCQGLTKIDLPSSVKVIEAHAFHECKALLELALHDGLETIGDDAFVNCNKLEALALPATLTSIGYESFANCTSLKEVTFPQSLTTIGEKAFNYCTGLTSVNLPNSVTSIGQFAFSHNESLTSIHIPEKLATLPQDMLSYCYKLTNVEIPTSVQELSQGVFYNDNSLISIILPEGITIVPVSFCTGCTSLVNVIMPSTITAIQAEAFKDCISLQSVTLPVAVETIGSSAFSNCSAMTSVYSLNTTPPSIESSTWSGVTGNATLYVPSDEAVAAYEIANYWNNFKSIEKMDEGLPCAQPSFSFADYKLSMETKTTGASIYYTNDGSDPTDSETQILYTSPIDFWKNDTIRAVAVKAGMSPSPIGTYIRNDFKVATPEISISDDLIITITTEEPVPVETKFYYIYNNGDSYPSCPSTMEEILAKCTLYNGEYLPQKPGHMYAIALRDGWIISDWKEFDYYNDYYLDEPTFDNNQSKHAVILTHSDEDVAMYYTLDGTEPTVENGTLYTDTIFLTENCTVKAFATKFKHFNSEVREQSFSWFRVAKPTISFSAITVTIGCEKPYDAIYYTLDGTTPTRQSAVYTEPFTLDKNCYVKAMAVHKNWTDSEIASEYYNADDHTCLTPSFIENKTDSTLTITSTEGASIYYTIDGTDPTNQSTLYTGPIKIKRNDTVRAIAMRDDMIPSPIGQFIITWVQLHEPIISFNGIYCVITQDKSGSTIYYTTDETDPTKSTTRKVFTEPFILTERTVIKTYAVMDKYLDSEVASRTFDPTGKKCETPSISRVESTSNFIQMNTKTEGATIYYTTNGLTPTKSDKVYTEPFEVTQNQTIKAIAMMDTYYDSEVGTFEVDWFTVARPVITIDGVLVTITCATPDAKIYYTLDGSKPTTEDNLYTGVLTMTGDCTIKAFAVRDNFNDSQSVESEFSMKAYTCGTPTFNRIPTTNFVSISSTIPEGISTPTIIYYTIDGSVPTRESKVFDKEKIYIEMAENCTLKALAVNDKLFDSAIGEFAVDWFKVDTPAFSYDEEGRLIISCDTANVTIYYDFDKAATTNSKVYTEPIVLTDNRTVYAFGTRKNFLDSDMAQETPGAFVCDAVAYEYNGRYLTMTANEGAAIYYTIDGSTPTEQSLAYSAPVEITALCTVKAVAKKKDYTDSEITSFEVTYLFNGEDVDMSEAGHLEEVFEWAGGTEGLTSLPVKGQVNDDDIRFIKSISTLEHLDLSNATVAGKRLASEAFAGMNIVSFESPKEVGEIGEHLFKGCKKLAAIVWNASSAIPQEVLDDIENPNLLLFVNSRNLAPNTYTGNLISGGEATSITLYDTETGGAFYCPQRFFAQSISYTHEYKQPTPDPLAHTAQGWETLALPFDVQTITHETRGEMAPFAKGADVAKFKPFWLYTLTGTGFVRTAEIKAYTPYIISMPNHTSYADDYILAGKVTFSSAGVYVDADQANIATKGSVDFIPSFQRIAPANDIMNINLNDCTDGDGYSHVNGSAFIPGLREVRPFEAYALDHSLQSKVLRIGDLMDLGATDIHNAEMKALEQLGGHEGIYDVSGRKISNSEMELRRERILEPGVYIINGKKMVVK